MNGFWTKAADILSGGIFKQLGEAVNDLVTTDKERMELQAKLVAIQQQAEYEMQKLAFDDVANARAREMALQNSIGVWVMNGLAVLIFVSYVVQIFLLMYVAIPAENRDLLMQTKETTENIVLLICGYYFGSSAGSRIKDKASGNTTQDK